MRIRQISWILAGLLLAHASAADDAPESTPQPTPGSNTPAQQLMIGTWKLDQSCEQYLETIQKAFEDATTLVERAQTTLKGALKPRPKHGAGAIKNWDRVAKAVKVMFGFLPDVKSQNSEQDLYWEDVFYVYDRMVKGLRDLEPLQYGDLDPVIACKDDIWVWKDADMRDPTLPDDVTEGVTIRERYPKTFSPKMKKPYVGGYYWNGRWIWRKAGDQSPVTPCDKEGGSTVVGVTSPDLDMIQLCEYNFDEKVMSRKSPVDALETTKIGDHLNNLDGLAPTLVHELAHWYGIIVAAGEPTIYLPDQIARTKEGKFVYKNTETGAEVLKSEELDKPAKKKLAPKATYGFKNLQLLSQKSGPTASTRTADAYAYFAMMAYLDKWDWSRKGTAEAIKYDTTPPS